MSVLPSVVLFSAEGTGLCHPHECASPVWLPDFVLLPKLKPVTQTLHYNPTDTGIKFSVQLLVAPVLSFGFVCSAS